MTFFGVDLAGLVAAVAGPQVQDAVLISKATGTRTPGNLGGGTNPTSTSYLCRGYPDGDFVVTERGGLVRETRGTICLLGATIAGGTVAPKPQDQVTIGGVTYTIEKVPSDGHGALYECEVIA